MARSYTAPEGETVAAGSYRRGIVARRQASLAGKTRIWSIGDPIGPHKFDGFVGENSTSLYIYYLCAKCGNRLTIRRDNISQAARTQGCKFCNRGRRSAK